MTNWVDMGQINHDSFYITLITFPSANKLCKYYLRIISFVIYLFSSHSQDPDGSQYSPGIGALDMKRGYYTHLGDLFLCLMVYCSHTYNLNVEMIFSEVGRQTHIITPCKSPQSSMRLEDEVTQSSTH